MVPGGEDGDFDRLLSETRRSLESLRARPTGAERVPDAPPVRGTGEACEGEVRAVASEGRLETLELGPRLMRMTPEQLAPHLVTAANAALDDLRAKAPVADAGAAVDPGVLAERLGEVANEGLARMATISNGLTDAMARISRDARVSGDPGDQGLESLLTQAQRTVEAASAAAPGEAPQIRGEGSDADGQIRAVVATGDRVETLQLDPPAMRAPSYVLGERVVTAINAALEDVRARVREQFAAAGRQETGTQVKAVQDLSLQQMRAYTQALAALMSSIERR
jgi:DNA-binding protein YbaB